MKIVELQEFFNRAGIGPEHIGAFQGSSWGDYNIKLYYGKEFRCGCKKTHTFSHNHTKIHWYKNTMLGQKPEMILQESGCSHINYIKMEGIFIVKFETLFSANALEMQEGIVDKIKKSKFMCLKCKIKFPIENSNLDKKCSIFMPAIPAEVRQSDGLEIRILLCLKCNNITSFASDPNNDSGKAIDFVEYFELYKLNRKLKEKILDCEKEFYEMIPIASRKIYLEKINKIKKIKV